jgi:formylglycine-generating enzyme required for sulfatase activity
MAKVNTDCDLLFGILALQMDFIGREDLIAAVSAWVLDKQKPLAQIMVDQGSLSATRRALLEPLIEEHLALHGNDPARSLASVEVASSVRKDLETLDDPDVRASLAAVSAARGATAEDPYATRTPAEGAGSIPRFRILRPHARGGLGEVFVARDEELNRQVALKEIQSRLADRPESRTRFVLEAEITGALEHPGIVPVYALGHYPDGRPFYAMRFIRGDNLNNAIKHFHRAEGQGHDPSQRALAFRKLLGRFIDVCNVMAYAHSKGVLHRDLKPDNIMLGKYGETLVVDWGLAKAIGRLDPGASADEEPVMPASGGSGVETLPGRAFGTPAFISPEQAAGELERLGPAGDVYSLGATLYAVLTGRLAFEDRDPGAALQKVLKGEFPHPRQVNRQVPRALEAVCLKAMALKPEERYRSARALADDTERWLADEPVSAWREPPAVRARRWMARHRTLVTSAAAALVVGLAALGYFLYDARLRATQRLAQANGRVDALATAEIREVPGIIQQLQPDRRLVLDRLRTLVQTDPAGPSGRRSLHAALALLPDDPSQAEVLAERLQQADARPDELIVIRRALQDHGHAAALMPQLWALLKPTETELSDSQLRAAGILALSDPKNPRWQALGGPIAAKLVRENPLRIGAWREVFQPISVQLVGPLRAALGNWYSPEERVLAFTLLFDFATQPGNPRQPEDLAELIGEANPAQFRQMQFRQILDQLTDRRRAIARLTSLLDQPARSDDARARRQGQVAAALVALGQPERAWPLLKQGDDPGVRTEFLHHLAAFGADPRVVITRLATEPDTSARRALVMSLGEYPIAHVPTGERRALTAALLIAYQAEPDPGLHSAIDWLLRQKWNQAGELDRVDRERVGPGSTADRDWYVNTQGQTMAIVRGPVEFLMGSPESETGRDTEEIQHRVRIDRSFAIATREVTVAQYRRFLDQNSDVSRIDEDERVKSYIPAPDCPIVGLDWYDGVRYCNWLSRQEGIPEEQWCYPKEIKPGMTLPPDLLIRTGYRLPTEAEWEYACRAGSAAPRPWGGSEAMLPMFSWFMQNAARQTRPAGRLKPNDLGLFDVLGNAWEWTQTVSNPYRSSPDDPAGGDEEMVVEMSNDMGLVLRGGSFGSSASSLRSAGRGRLRSSDRGVANGIRPARTCLPIDACQSSD